MASLPPISAEVFTEKVLQARAATTAEADKALFERSCDVCQRSYNSENAYSNHMSSQKHRSRVLAQTNGKHAADDAASSIMSSTFSLGDPIPTDKDSVDSDAEQEFHEIVEGLDKTKLNDVSAPSPVGRPSNPHPSAQQEAEASMSVDSEDRSTTPVPTKGEPTWTSTVCIFCNYNSPTVPLSAHHMERFHGMFIPEKKYLVDAEGLLKHLQKCVYERHQCIACGKVKSNTFAVQTHMRDKSHCTIPYTSLEEQLEIGEFYDFRSTYSDDGEDSEDDEMQEAEPQGGAKVAFKPKYAKMAFGGSNDDSDGDEDGEWETDSEDESLASEEITAVYNDDVKYDRLEKHTHHSKHDPRHHHQADGWHSHAHKHAHAVFYDDYSLHLPSGKSVGHRSLNVYFRQNLHSHPSPVERAERLAIEAEINRAAMSGDRMEVDEDEEDNDRQVAVIANVAAKAGRQVSRRDALGMVGLPEATIKSVQRREARARASQNRREDNFMWKKGRQGNKTEKYAWNIGLANL